MNCLACRQHLEPFLDDELSVKDNVAVLEHVTRARRARTSSTPRSACGSRSARAFCAGHLPAPGRASASSPPSAPRPAGPASGSALLWAPPVAAAIAVAFLIPGFLERRARVVRSAVRSAPPARAPARKIFAVERTHDHAVHGEFLAWAGARYDELTDDLPHGKVLNAETLKHVEPRSAGRRLARGVREGREGRAEDELQAAAGLHPGRTRRRRRAPPLGRGLGPPGHHRVRRPRARPLRDLAVPREALRLPAAEALRFASTRRERPR